MTYLLISDLMGTLLEARQICCIFDPSKHEFRDIDVEREYSSRISYMTRKLNNFIDSGNKVSIVTSINHFTYYQLVIALKDIDKKIKSSNKNKIEYNICDVEDRFYDEVCELLKNIDIDLKARIHIFGSRENAYNQAISKNKGLYLITMDDDINMDCIPKVINLGGQFIYIYNPINSKGWIGDKRYHQLERFFHLDDNIDRLISYYEHIYNNYYNIDKYNLDANFSKYFRFSKDEIYQKFLSGNLDIEKLYSWLVYRDTQIEFRKVYSYDHTQNLFDRNVIQIYPSFEQAYKKVLVPKMKK